MTQEVIDRVAIAIMQSDRFVTADFWDREEMTPEDKDHYRKLARAAVEAIRELDYAIVPRRPTESMLDAGVDRTWEPSSDRPYIDTDTLREVWRIMIDGFDGE